MTVPAAAPWILLRGFAELVTNDPTAGPGPSGIVPNAAVIIDDGRIGGSGRPL